MNDDEAPDHLDSVEPDPSRPGAALAAAVAAFNLLDDVRQAAQEGAELLERVRRGARAGVGLMGRLRLS